MTPKELYEKYAGRKARLDDYTGIVCGYDKVKNRRCPLVMATSELLVGWENENMKIVTHKKGYAYLWVSEEDIIN